MHYNNNLYLNKIKYKQPYEYNNKNNLTMNSEYL